MKTYYKVTIKNDFGDLKSYSSCNYGIIYSLNKWVKPRLDNSYLFVFDNFENAKNYAIACDCDIYTCQIKGKIKATKTIPGSSSGRHPEFWDWLNRLRKQHKKIESPLWAMVTTPKGTVFCKEVMLTSKINRTDWMLKI